MQNLHPKENTKTSFMKKHHLLIVVLCVFCLNTAAQSSGFAKLDEWTGIWKETQQTFFGYPLNEQSALHGFYQWYVASGMDVVNLKSREEVSRVCEASFLRNNLHISKKSSTFAGEKHANTISTRKYEPEN